jgi:hypothetical protein
MLNNLVVGLLFVAGTHEVDGGHPLIGILLWVVAYFYLDRLLKKA